MTALSTVECVPGVTCASVGAARPLHVTIIGSGGAVQGVFFSRRSTLSLASQGWGELRMGRDYTPTFWNISQFSPFGTISVGGSANIVEGWPFGLGGARTQVRADNSVGYFLPRDIGGFYGQAMLATSEGVNGANYRGAHQLPLSPKTVSTYRARLLEKLSLHNNSELTRYALTISSESAGRTARPVLIGRFGGSGPCGRVRGRSAGQQVTPRARLGSRIPLRF